jgi:hypothetical protein
VRKHLERPWGRHIIEERDSWWHPRFLNRAPPMSSLHGFCISALVNWIGKGILSISRRPIQMRRCHWNIPYFVCIKRLYFFIPTMHTCVRIQLFSFSSLGIMMILWTGKVDDVRLTRKIFSTNKR